MHEQFYSELQKSISELNFAQAKSARDACEARMQALQEQGAEDLAKKFEAEALEATGLSARAVLALMRKARRKRTKKDE